MSTESCIKVFLRMMIACANVLATMEDWIGSSGVSSFATSQSCLSSIAGNFLQRLADESMAARAR
jgi:hypothetical protein